MERPNINDYLATNQFEYHQKLNQYYKALKKYCDYLEAKTNNL